MQHSQDPFVAGEDIILKCLTKKFSEEAAYGSLNSLRSAISLINNGKTSESPLLQRFMKGVFKLRPTKPKYATTWDVGVVLEKLESWSPSDSLDLQELSLKLVMLLALGSAFRVQSLSLIKLKNIKSLKNGVEIKIEDLVKTSRPGAEQPYAFFPFFKNKISLCVATTILHYIDRTKDIREGVEDLLISFKKPHKKVGTQTISRWLKTVMKEAGIEEHYSAHSTRHASTSKAFSKGIDLNTIKNAAGWSEKSSVFAKFYNKPVKYLENNFAEAVLSN